MLTKEERTMKALQETLETILMAIFYTSEKVGMENEKTEVFREELEPYIQKLDKQQLFNLVSAIHVTCNACLYPQVEERLSFTLYPDEYDE